MLCIADATVRTVLWMFPATLLTTELIETAMVLMIATIAVATSRMMDLTEAANCRMIELI